MQHYFDTNEEFFIKRVQTLKLNKKSCLWDMTESFILNLSKFNTFIFKNDPHGFVFKTRSKWSNFLWLCCISRAGCHQWFQGCCSPVGELFLVCCLKPATNVAPEEIVGSVQLHDLSGLPRSPFLKIILSGNFSPIILANFNNFDTLLNSVVLQVKMVTIAQYISRKMTALPLETSE